MKPSNLDAAPSTPGREYSAEANGAVSPDTPRTLVCQSPTDPSHVKNDQRSVSPGSLRPNKPEPRTPNGPLKGWPQLAMLMDKNPDLAAFPRYRDLNVKSLLYYQAELTIFRRKLYDLEWEDADTDYAEYADKLVESHSEQFQTVKDMRKVLKEYNEALLQFSQICALPDPEPFNMRTLREWLRNDHGAAYSVRGSDGLRHIWGTLYGDEDPGLPKKFARLLKSLVGVQPSYRNERDLAVTTPATKVDGLTRWVATELVPFGRAVLQHLKDLMEKAKKPHDEETQSDDDSVESVEEEASPEKLPWDDQVEKEETLVSWSEKGALKATSALSTVVACLLPVVAISILSQLHGLRNLLGCLAGFASLFAIVLIFLTQGTSSRTEIFAATAA
ncbi:hypothetical protein K469DRAFT_603778 [Zopfia rhizophila CBS 207.26]|uniref:DUF6594 domain-containing protein n=1 Tax=Zopfia rhizophila CBS 207.26 TaxID=1314779 RepID=A0A6A6DFV7_9PEZI|nr:hypothetical protein K469DRAFT_603778 [Zopfia rhizophila CBS 207.26]